MVKWGDLELTSSNEHIKNTSSRGTHRKLGTGRRNPLQPKLLEKSPCNWAGQKRASARTCGPGRDLSGGEGARGWTIAPRSERVGSLPGHPSPGLLNGGDKLSRPSGNVLRQREGLEQPRLYL